MQIACVLFEGLTALDIVGPYEVLRGLPGADVRFVATAPGEYRTDNGRLALVADQALADVPAPDIVVVPGGRGEAGVRDDPTAIAWLQQAHTTSTWTTSVCTGSLVLGKAGILAGKRATSHWTALEVLRDFGAEPTLERVVFDGKVVTAAGVSAGIDMALRLVAEIAGDEIAQQIQLTIEYDPQPPFAAGSPARAPAAMVAFQRERSRFRQPAT